MKRYFILFLFLGFLSCDKDAKEDSVPLSASKIIGSWQLVEAYVSPGGDTTWQTVEDGDIYNFNINSTFSQTNTFENTYDRSGNFIYDDEILELTFRMDGEEKWQSFRVDMDENSMTITPSGPAICIEACLYRYAKIK